MERQELINRVKAKCDEILPVDAGVCELLILPNTKSIDIVAGEVLDEAARDVLLKAPAGHLRGTICLNPPVGDDDGTGYVDLPDDFIRLLEFKMSDWQRPVTMVCEEGSSVALKQYNRYMRGGIAKPVCVLGHEKNSRALRYYSSGEHDVDRFVYVADCPAEELPELLQDALTWLCTSRVLKIFGKESEAKSAYEMGINLL